MPVGDLRSPVEPNLLCVLWIALGERSALCSWDQPLQNGVSNTAPASHLSTTKTYPMICQRRKALSHPSPGMQISKEEEEEEANQDCGDHGPFDRVGSLRNAIVSCRTTKHASKAHTVLYHQYPLLKSFPLSSVLSCLRYMLDVFIVSVDRPDS